MSNEDCPQHRRKDDTPLEGCVSLSVLREWKKEHERRHELEKDEFQKELFQQAQMVERLRVDFNSRYMNMSDTTMEHKVKIANLENRIADAIATMKENSTIVTNMSIELGRVGVKVALFGLTGSIVGSGLVIPFVLYILKKMIP